MAVHSQGAIFTIFELRDVWWCKQRQLSTITGIENPDLFVWPPLPVPGPLPSVNTQAKDPFMIKDPWKAYVGTPTKTQRNHDVHSGMTPQLQRERQQLTDFLAGTESSLAPIQLHQCRNPTTQHRCLKRFWMVRQHCYKE